MFRRLGDEVAQLFEHFIAHDVLATRISMNIRLRRLPGLIGSQQLRVQIDVAAIGRFTLQLKIKRHMVNPGAAIAEQCRIDIQVTRQLFRRSLYGVT